jgi:hypothetical protein
LGKVEAVMNPPLKGRNANLRGGYYLIDYSSSSLVQAASRLYKLAFSLS